MKKGDMIQFMFTKGFSGCCVKHRYISISQICRNEYFLF